MPRKMTINTLKKTIDNNQELSKAGVIFSQTKMDTTTHSLTLALVGRARVLFSKGTSPP